MALLFANNNSLSAISAKPSGLSGGSMNLISTQTASGSSTISFTSGIDSTDDKYVFKFINIHPSAESRFAFQTSTNGGSSYGVTATTTFFQAYHREDTGDTFLGYNAGEDQAQSTDFINFGEQIDPSSADHSNSGELFVYSPSSTTFVKHFMARQSQNYVANYLNTPFIAGYFNSTNAINAFQFKMESGNIDAGDICLYGIA
jgi:hypothetical protein